MANIKFIILSRSWVDNEDKVLDSAPHIQVSDVL